MGILEITVLETVLNLFCFCSFSLLLLCFSLFNLSDILKYVLFLCDSNYWLLCMWRIDLSDWIMFRGVKSFINCLPNLSVFFHLMPCFLFFSPQICFRKGGEWSSPEIDVYRVSEAMWNLVSRNMFGKPYSHHAEILREGAFSLWNAQSLG